jgi:hypothetical protein
MNATVEANTIQPGVTTWTEPHWFTLGQAAKAVGRSKAALSRAVKNGTLSAEKQPDGSFRIAASELFRVYRPVNQTEPVRRVDDPAELNALNRELRVKLEAATERLTEIKAELADLREDRDQWREQAQRLSLTDQRMRTAPAPPAQPQPVVTNAEQSPPHVSSTPAPSEAVAPATDKAGQYPPRIVAKKASAATKRVPKAEVSWFRRMIGGR